MENTEVRLAAALATVGKTREQLEAEKKAKALAEKQARWNKALAERAKLTEPFTCEARVGGSGYGWHGSHACGKTAKYHREGRLEFDVDSPMVTRHYCGQHDPITKREREQAKWAEEKRVRDEKFARDERIRQRHALIHKFVGDISSEVLQKLLDQGTTLHTLLYADERKGER